MTKTNLIKVSKQELNEMVVNYQQNPTEVLYMDIHDAIFPVAEKISFAFYHKYTSIQTVTAEDYVQCARLAVFKAVKAYDIEKGGNFTALVKQLTEWTIMDEIIEKEQNKKNTFNSSALSLDKPLGTDEGTFLDVVEHQFATDVEAVFEAVVAEYSHDEKSMGAILTDLVTGFSAGASEKDSQIIMAWVATILSVSDTSKDIKQAVNKAIMSVMPDVASATVRQNKGRAEKRFNEYAQKNGYPSFCLSQF